MSRLEKINTVASLTKGLLESGFTINEIMTGIHNACVHGKNIEDNDGNVTDENLSELYKGFDICLEATKTM